MKEHIRGTSVQSDGSCTALCGARAKAGEWKAGAAFEGLRILGIGADQFCAECSREWILIKHAFDNEPGIP